MEIFNRRRFAMSAVIVLAVCTATATARADDATDAYKVAVGYYKKSRWSEAATAFRGFVAKYRTDDRLPFARLYLGVSLEYQEKYNEARTVLRGFVRDYPKNANRSDAMFRVAECSYFLDDLKTAEKEFLAFLAAAPKHDFAEFALPYLGDAQLRLSKPREAAASFKQSLDRFGTGRMAEQSKFGLALAYERTDRKAAAQELYKSLAENAKSSRAAEARMKLATLYFDAEQYDAAAREFDRLAEKHKTSSLIAQARLNAGFSYYRSDKFKQAVERFGQAATDKSQRTQADYWTGLSHKALGEHRVAAEVLKRAWERDGKSKSKLADEILYQLATTTRLAGDALAAKSRYLEYAKEFPTGEAADDALHFAGELALDAGRLDEAQQLIDRFKKEHAGSGLWTFQAILQGRVLEARGGGANLKRAVTEFQSVVDRSKLERTQNLARFYQARSLRRLRDHKRAVAVLAPVYAEVKQTGKSSEFVDALIPLGNSRLELDQHAEAAEAFGLYVDLQPNGADLDQALAGRASAFGKLDKTAQADADLKQLLAKRPESPLYPSTVHQLAEFAYGKKNWKWAESLFRRLVDLGKDSTQHAPGLSGLAWTQFERQKYAESAATFARVTAEHPAELELATQAAYKRGEALEKAGKASEAVGAWQQAFADYAPKEPAAAGSEAKGKPHFFAYHSGLMAARTLGKLKKTDEAHAAYAKLLEKFPKPADLDLRLDEWALLNYNAGRYDKADDIFRRLLKEAPGSKLADNARYTLAESDLNDGRLDDAKKSLEKLYRAKTSDAVVREVSHYRLIQIAAEQDRWSDAGRLAGEFAALYPKSQHRGYALFNLAESQVRSGRYPDALKTLTTLKALPADSAAARSNWYPRVWVLLAEMYYRGKDYGKVVTTVDEMRTRFAKSPLLYQADDVMGRAFKNQAKFDKAREAFRRVVEHPSGRRTETAAKCQFLLGETYLAQEDFQQARKEYFKVYTLYKFPEWQAPALLMIGRCDEALKEWKNAARTYRDLVKEFPQSPFAAQAGKRLPVVEKKAAM